MGPEDEPQPVEETEEQNKKREADEAAEETFGTPFRPANQDAV